MTVKRAPRANSRVRPMHHYCAVSTKARLCYTSQVLIGSYALHLDIPAISPQIRHLSLTFWNSKDSELQNKAGHLSQLVNSCCVFQCMILQDPDSHDHKMESIPIRTCWYMGRYICALVAGPISGIRSGSSCSSPRVTGPVLTQLV